jgi:hypothetical protein
VVLGDEKLVKGSHLTMGAGTGSDEEIETNFDEDTGSTAVELEVILDSDADLKDDMGEPAFIDLLAEPSQPLWSI